MGFNSGFKGLSIVPRQINYSNRNLRVIRSLRRECGGRGTGGDRLRKITQISVRTAISVWILGCCFGVAKHCESLSLSCGVIICAGMCQATERLE